MSFLSTSKGWVVGALAYETALARFISNFISPPLVGILTAIAFIYYTVPQPQTVLFWLAWALPLICLPPLAYVIWLVRTGELADIHMPDRSSRIKPLTVILGWSIISLLTLHFLGAPAVLILVMVATMAYMMVMSAVTLFWKISFHSSAVAAAASVGLVASGLTTGWTLSALMLIPIVGWARVRLRRHTLSQVLAGCMAGMGMGLILLI
jgi:membrane-associated phospholipid phosphatase